MVESFDDRENHLLEWNNEHKRLWKILCKLSIVEIDDCDKFIKFCDFFDTHIELNKRPPTVNESIDFFKYL